jgi:hypothetical protein
MCLWLLVYVIVLYIPTYYMHLPSIVGTFLTICPRTSPMTSGSYKYYEFYVLYHLPLILTVHGISSYYDLVLHPAQVRTTSCVRNRDSESVHQKCDNTW